ncbi:unnamed protein product [Amoebophrya sp. A120]|nr:unnamed protein product [Amoebophrya sp. A120]|eukprot:GSA120T00011624001.1
MGATESTERVGRGRVVRVSSTSPYERGFRIGEAMLEDLLRLYQAKVEVYKASMRPAVIQEWDLMAEKAVDSMEDFAPTSYVELEGMVAGCQAQWERSRGGGVEEPPFLKMLMRLAVDYELLMSELHARSSSDFVKHTEKFEVYLQSMKGEHDNAIVRNSQTHEDSWTQMRALPIAENALLSEQDSALTESSDEESSEQSSERQPVKKKANKKTSDHNSATQQEVDTDEHTAQSQSSEMNQGDDSASSSSVDQYGPNASSDTSLSDDHLEDHLKNKNKPKNVLPAGRQGQKIQHSKVSDIERLASGSSSLVYDHNLPEGRAGAKYARGQHSDISRYASDVTDAPDARHGARYHAGQHSDFSRYASSVGAGDHHLQLAGQQQPDGRHGKVHARDDDSHFSRFASTEYYGGVPGGRTAGGRHMHDSDISRLASTEVDHDVGSAVANLPPSVSKDSRMTATMRRSLPSGIDSYGGGGSVLLAGKTTSSKASLDGGRPPLASHPENAEGEQDDLLVIERNATVGTIVSSAGRRTDAVRYGSYERNDFDVGCTGIATLYGGMHPNHRVISGQTNDESPAFFDDGKHDVVILSSNRSLESELESGTESAAEHARNSIGSEESGNGQTPALNKMSIDDQNRLETWCKKRVTDFLIPMLSANLDNFMQEMRKMNILFTSKELSFHQGLFLEPCASMIYTHPGQGAYMGLNAYGVSVLWQYIDNGERGQVSGCEAVVTNTLIREMLLLPSAKHALAYLHAVYIQDLIGIPNCFTISDPGYIYSAEVSNSTFVVEEAHPVQGGTIVHGNHLQYNPETIGPPPVGKDMTLMKPSNSKWRVKHSTDFLARTRKQRPAANGVLVSDLFHLFGEPPLLRPIPSLTLQEHLNDPTFQEDYSATLCAMVFDNEKREGFFRFWGDFEFDNVETRKEKDVYLSVKLPTQDWKQGVKRDYKVL